MRAPKRAIARWGWFLPTSAVKFPRSFVCLLLFLQGPFDLPTLHSFDGDRLDFLANPFFFQKGIEGRTRGSRSLGISFYTHCSPFDSTLLLPANAERAGRR